MKHRIGDLTFEVKLTDGIPLGKLHVAFAIPTLRSGRYPVDAAPLGPLGLRQQFQDDSKLVLCQEPDPGPDAFQVFATEYQKACEELDRSEAGRRARNILFEHLSEDQLRDVERYNHFDVRMNHDDEVLRTALRGLPDLTLPYFRIRRGFPNGNIDMIVPARRTVNRERDERYTMCIHPIFPLPTDDICLAQKALIERHLDEFVTTGNATSRNASDWGRLIKFSRAWRPRRVPKRTDLLLPFLREYPIPDNVVLGEE